MCAKVSGPLHSDGASGKVFDALVFFNWKGVNVVRQWLKPANPQAPTQGNQRIILGGTGRSVGEILPRPGFTTVSAFAQQLITLKLIPGGQTKQSFLVKYIIDHYLTGTTGYAAMLLEMTSHAGAYTAFKASADTLGIVEFDLAYATIAPYDKALGLYLLAKTAIALGFSGAPYTTPLASWVTAEVTGMVADFTGA